MTNNQDIQSEIERETETDRDRQTERQRDTERQRQTQRDTERQRQTVGTGCLGKGGGGEEQRGERKRACVAKRMPLAVPATVYIVSLAVLLMKPGSQLSPRHNPPPPPTHHTQSRRDYYVSAAK